MNSFKKSSGLIIILGWLLFFTYPLLLTNDGQGWEFTLLSSPYYWQFCLFYFIVFYLNSKLLAPFLLQQKKYILYILSVLLLFAVVYFIKPFDDLLHHSLSLRYVAVPLTPPEGMREGAPPKEFRRERFPGGNTPPDMRPPSGNFPPDGPPFRPQHDITSLFIFVVVITLSTAVEATQRWRVTERRAAIAEAEKAKAELSFLKAQINPHFLFNTLNNIYSLAMMSHENTAESIMKLSNIMRFVTDDVKEDQIPLIHEVECIKDYIDLQKLRLGKGANITYEVSGNVHQKSITPMILMTFVENAFKHGISKRMPSPVEIKIEASDKRIYFHCRNRFFNHQTLQERNGIGIENTKQRLQHVYSKNHRLEVERSETMFTVTLEIYNT